MVLDTCNHTHRSRRQHTLPTYQTLQVCARNVLQISLSQPRILCITSSRSVLCISRPSNLTLTSANLHLCDPSERMAESQACGNYCDEGTDSAARDSRLSDLVLIDTNYSMQRPSDCTWQTSPSLAPSSTLSDRSTKSAYSEDSNGRRRRQSASVSDLDCQDCMSNIDSLSQYSTQTNNSGSSASPRGRKQNNVWSSSRKGPLPSPPRSPRSKSPICRTPTQMNLLEAHMAVKEMAKQSDLLQQRLRWNFKQYLSAWRFYGSRCVLRALKKLHAAFQLLEAEFWRIVPSNHLDMVEQAHREFGILMIQGDGVNFAVTETKSCKKTTQDIRRLSKDVHLLTEQVKDLTKIIATE